MIFKFDMEKYVCIHEKRYYPICAFIRKEKKVYLKEKGPTAKDKVKKYLACDICDIKPSECLLAFGGKDKMLYLVHVRREGEDMYKFKGAKIKHENVIREVKLSRKDGNQYLAFGGQNKTVDIYLVNDLINKESKWTESKWRDIEIEEKGNGQTKENIGVKNVKEIKPDKCGRIVGDDWVEALAFNEDSSLLAVGSKDSSVKVYQVDKLSAEGDKSEPVWSSIKSEQKHFEAVTTCTFFRKRSQNGENEGGEELLVSGSKDQRLIIRSFEKNTEGKWSDEVKFCYKYASEIVDCSCYHRNESSHDVATKTKVGMRMSSTLKSCFARK